jgi:hypothetical protein
MRSASGGADVPSRRTGKRATPDYPSQLVPDTDVLLRDAQPTRTEILREPDARQRREAAIDHLVRMFNDAKRTRKIKQLDYRVRMFCEELKKRNRGLLPKSKGGRPPGTGEHRAVLFAVRVKEAIESGGGKWGSKEAAYREISDRYRASYDYVKEIYLRAFGEHPDPDFREAVDLALCDRNLPLSD